MSSGALMETPNYKSLIKIEVGLSFTLQPGHKQSGAKFHVVGPRILLFGRPVILWLVRMAQGAVPPPLLHSAPGEGEGRKGKARFFPFKTPPFTLTGT